ncbi:MAG: outer membrane beta-barrel protein [bacterium]|jgi:hypothetical protein
MRLTLLLFALAGACLGQRWQLGGGAGGAVYPDVTVSSGSVEAEAGFDTAPAFTVFAVHDMYEHVGGEIRYTFQFTDMKVSSNGVKASSSAQTHAFSYALLLYPNRREAPVRPYFLAGGGGKVYWGTGEQAAAAPPNAQFAILTQTSEIKGMATFGGGVSVRVSDRVRLRFDVRDNLTPFPKEVIAPVPGATIDGWLHCIVTTVGVSFRM